METTNKLFSGFAATRARLAVLVATCVAATLGAVTPAAAQTTTPTITFAAATVPSPVLYPSAGFTVGATTDSDGALTYSRVSGPCALVNGSTGAFSVTAPGTCLVQADSASTNKYLAGTAQQSVAIGVGPASFDLYANVGSTTIDGAAVPVWGYAATSAQVTKPGGPTLVVYQGAQVTINLHNNLPTAVSTALLVQGQKMVPDTAGVAAGATKSYSFKASEPGTYLYEAGLIPGTEYQAAMGLYGALVVRPTASGQAYGSLDTAFDDEAVLVISEIDPRLNVSPATFDMREFKPWYFLINGSAYPNTDAIASAAGRKVLLRYLNAGAKHHSMSMLGARQKVIAEDGSPLQFPRTVVAKTIAPGQTADAIVTMPTVGTAFAIYDGNLMLHNSGLKADSEFGGMLTFVTIPAATPVDTIGPATSGVVLTVNGVTATVSDAASGGSNVTAAEYFLDVTPGPDGSGTPMNGAFGPPGSPTVNVSSTFAAALAGPHTVSVHGKDAAGNWGSFATATIVFDNVGPTTTTLVLTPNPSNGSGAIALSATASDVASGNANVLAAEYAIDGGSPVSITVPTPAPTVNLAATIPAGTVSALAQGAHVVSVRGKDANGNWGAAATTSLFVDRVGPTTSTPVLAPNPSNGTAAIALSATASDVASGNANVVAAEYTIDGGTTAVSIPIVAPSPTVNLTGSIPAGTVSALTSGAHIVSVRGRDANGNWGAAASTSLLVDKVGPVASLVVASPNPNNGAFGFNSSTPAVRVTATMTDAQSKVVAAEGSIDGGASFPMLPVDGQFSDSTENVYADIPLATVNTLSVGNHTISVRGRDAAGNWGGAVSTTLTIEKTAPTLSAVSLSATTIAFGTASVNLSITAADNTGGVGLAGGRYWIDGTATPPLTATPFASNTSATVNTSALAGGVHTVYVQVRDLAGNWSTVRSVSLTVVQAVNDTTTFTANNNATQNVDLGAAAGVRVNDLPAGGLGIGLASAPVRASGTGNGTVVLSCPNGLGTAGASVGGSTICTNGAYRIIASGVGSSGVARHDSKLGTFTFTYTNTRNGVASNTATVTITVNP